MAKMRVHELAKELDIKSADIVSVLSEEKGIDVKAASSIEDDNIDFIRSKFGAKANKESEKADKASEKETKVAEKEETKDAGEEKKAKPRVLITSKGVVRTGERRSHGDGERRKRRHSGEHKHHKHGEKSSSKSDERGKAASEKVNETPVASAPVVETPVVETPVVEAPVVETPVVETPVVETPVASAPTAETKEPSPKAEEKKPERIITGPVSERPAGTRRMPKQPDRNAQNKGKKDAPNRNNDRKPNGDRNANKDNRGFNKERNQNNRNQNQGNRDNRDNRDRNNNFRDRNNNGGQRGDFRKNNDRDRDRNQSSAPSETIQDKNKKTRENKLRQDRRDNQNRNNRNYEDGNGKRGKNGKRNDFSKPVLQKPKKKEEKKEEIKIIQVPDSITIGELADRMKMTASTIIKKLFLEGKMVTVNTEIDFDSAEEIALGYEIMCEKEEKVDIIEELLKEEAEDESLMVKRPPVVCVMGHVDHGKTSLLDAIRETNVISGEAGGITQHIGASVVSINGQTITFLDTPGHEAFTSMRMRGAQSTDIAILVVAADDGVMPQTVEAINHAKAAEIEIIVAINKIDKPGANIERVKQGLAEHGLLAADWGGDIEMVPVSAHTREGIDDLLEMVLLQADVLELKANPNRQARGIIIEAKLDKGKGPVATVLVQKGTLKVGANIAAGANYGKLRAMSDDKGNQLKVAGPSTPVEILGLSGVPNAGEVFVSTEKAAEAKDFANTFVEDSKAKLMESNKFRISLDDLNSQIEAGELKELNIIIKADVQGSVEAVKQSLVKLSNDEVEVKVIHGGVGAINESDVILASASNAIIIGFNVKPDNQAEETAKNEGVDLRLYSVIYNAIDDIERAMKGLLEPIYEEKVIGHAEIRQIFKASGVGNIAGSYVLDGMVQRGCKVRVTREGELIFEGDLASLKRFKDDVKEVKAGYECGLVFEGFNEIRELDQVEAYIMVEVPR